MSSRSNYLVLAASEIKVRADSIIGFHGSAGTSVPSLLKPLVGYLLETEADFLKIIEQPPNVYERLEETFQIFDDARTTEGIELLMIGSTFFNERGLRVAPDSYFPADRFELNAVIGKPLSKRLPRGSETLATDGDFDRAEQW